MHSLQVMIADSGKLQLVMKVLHLLANAGEKVLVFSQVCGRICTHTEICEHVSGLISDRGKTMLGPITCQSLHCSSTCSYGIETIIGSIWSSG